MFYNLRIPIHSTKEELTWNAAHFTSSSLALVLNNNLRLCNTGSRSAMKGLSFTRLIANTWHKKLKHPKNFGWFVFLKSSFSETNDKNIESKYHCMDNAVTNVRYIFDMDIGTDKSTPLKSFWMVWSKMFLKDSCSTWIEMILSHRVAAHLENCQSLPQRLYKRSTNASTSALLVQNFLAASETGRISSLAGSMDKLLIITVKPSIWKEFRHIHKNCKVY